MIAKATLTATECNSTDFDLYGPDRFMCPVGGAPDAHEITFWEILAKVQFDALMWGVGTAIGELPPYFVARAGEASTYLCLLVLFLSNSDKPTTLLSSAFWRVVEGARYRRGGRRRWAIWKASTQNKTHHVLGTRQLGVLRYPFVRLCMSISSLFILLF